MGRKAVNRPKNVDGQRATRTIFYRKILRKIVKGLFDVTGSEGFMNGINVDYILNTLITRGYIIFTETKAGVLPLRGTVTGNNYMYMPTTATIVVPGLDSMERTISEDCEILYLERTMDNWFWTFNDIIDVYAEQLASADGAIEVNLMNSRGAFIAEAETKAQAETIKSLYNDITNGDPLVVYRSNELSKDGLNVFFGNVKNNFIVDLVQDAKRSIMNEFLTVIGINNANTDKRERLITAEADANNVELAVNIADWKMNLKNCCDRINKMFDTINFEMKLKFDPEEISTVETGMEVEDDSGKFGRNMENTKSNK